jgi:hypothetical protein
MCEYCNSSPHHPRCPNAPEPPIFAECEECGAEIYDGDEYYKIGKHIFCESCVQDGCTTAEQEDYL